MSFRLFTAERTTGALNLFGFQPREWDQGSLTTGSVLTAQAAAAIMAQRVDDVRAFDMLRKLSQDGNTPLVDLAQRVIDTRSAGSES